MILVVGILVFLLITSCKQEKIKSEETFLSKDQKEKYRHSDSIITLKKAKYAAERARIKKQEKRERVLAERRHALDTLPLENFVHLARFSDDFVYDLKYATVNNFTKQQVYECGACYVRVPTAKALLEVSAKFKSLGYRIKFFDCYRPFSVQKKMWELFPNPYYLARPSKGSVHNRGGAVDLTLVDEEGNELDMGTAFDHFGKESHHAYTELAPDVLQNRKLLRSLMEQHGFWTIRTEWWHYNYKGDSRSKIADFVWECEN